MSIDQSGLTFAVFKFVEGHKRGLKANCSMLVKANDPATIKTETFFPDEEYVDFANEEEPDQMMHC